MNDLLTSGDIAEVTGVPMQTINEWSAKGVLAPTQNGRGQGRNRLFTKIDAVALAYGYAWRQGGIGLDLVKQIVNCVTRFSEKELLKEFKAGRKITILLPGAETELSAAPPSVQIPKALNLELVYHQVTDRLEQHQLKIDALRAQ